MIQNPPNLGIDLDPVRHPEGCEPGVNCAACWIEGARLLDGSGRDEIADVFIRDGKIAAIGTRPSDFPEHATRHDGRGAWLIPGVIDSWARLREPGLEHKATIATETLAAVAGGITTLIMPPDTDPVLDTIAVARFIKRRAQLAGRARVVTIGALTQGLKGELLAEMAELSEGGCVAVSNAHYPLKDLRLLRRALEYAATFDVLVVFEPRDPSLSKRGCAHEGAIATRLGLPGIPTAAETAPLAQLLAVLPETGARVHINNLSSRAGVQLVAQAKAEGLPVTASVSIHQLWLSEMDTDTLCGTTHVEPPLRSLRDRAALREALASGVIDCVISDHQPHETDAKLAPFPETEPGISGLDTLLPLMLKLVDDGVLSLPRALDALSHRPATLFGLGDAGLLAPGMRADLCLIAPETDWTLTAQTLRSAGRDTPFFGWDFRHRTVATWVNGRCVFSQSPTG
ncbi:dihydroorotase [Halothiobacillus sp. DCM-1]|uniref:dihydroorotase n=1 Tax=Halothiobacillus sp. DCM-1 TaxID=3112558 RepID=UPI0032551CA9